MPYANDNDRKKNGIKYRKNNKIKIKERKKLFYENNKPKILKKSKQWRLENIERDKENKKTWLQNNKDKSIKYHKEYHKEYYPKNKDNYKNSLLKKRFGITIEQYYEILKTQNNVCAICLLPETTLDNKKEGIKRLSVDHEHSSGRIRGLLCHNCNLGLGSFKDDAKRLHNAIAYLEIKNNAKNK